MIAAHASFRRRMIGNHCRRRETTMNTGILIIAFGFWLLQNSHFGWNAAPASDAELIADGITLLIFALAIR